MINSNGASIAGMSTMPLSDRLKEMRLSRQMSQEAVADACKVSRVAVSKWESGDTANIRLGNLMSLCRLYDVTADELITGKAPKTVHEYTQAPGRAHRVQDIIPPAWGSGAFLLAASDFLERFNELTDEGQAVVKAQIDVAIETARRIHGTGQENVRVIPALAQTAKVIPFPGRARSQGGQ